MYARLALSDYTLHLQFQSAGDNQLGNNGKQLYKDEKRQHLESKSNDHRKMKCEDSLLVYMVGLWDGEPAQ